MSEDRLIEEEEFENEDELFEEDLEKARNKKSEDEDDEDEDEDEDDLDEVDASLGDPSTAPDPTGKKVKPRMGDKSGGDKAPLKVKTKVGVINAMVEKMQTMNRSDLISSFDGLLSALHKKHAKGTDGEEIKETLEIRKITAEDIDLDEDLAAIFKNESELTEGFKSKATVIFEAAVVSKVNQLLENITAQNEAELTEAREEIYNEISEKLDEYLEYIAAEYVEENKIAIERGLRAEMVEEFLGGLKNLFTEHYVEIPEEKADIIEELVERVAELETELDETQNKLVESHKLVKDGEKIDIFEELSVDLTDTAASKFKDLAESVEFKDNVSYREKLETIKESYFGDDNGNTEIGSLTEELDYDGPIKEELKQVAGAMGAYVNAISRSARKE
jgi:hypothetical protein